MPPATALSFLLLALSLRLGWWQRLDLRSATQAKISRVLAGLAALVTLGAAMAPMLLGLGLCLLSAVVILQAYGSYLRLRRALLVFAISIGTWLVLANLYLVHGRVAFDTTTDPAPAVLMFTLSLALTITEMRSGLIPASLREVLGEQSSLRLVVAMLVVPLLLGYLRMRVEQVYRLEPNLLLAFHVMGSLLVMATLLLSGMNHAREKLDEHRRRQADLEATETALRMLLATGSEFYLAMNLAGRLLSANDRAMRAFGLPDLKRNVIAMEDIVVPESHEQLRRLPETLLRGVSASADLAFRLNDGQESKVHITAASYPSGAAGVEIVLMGRSVEAPVSSESLLLTA